MVKYILLFFLIISFNALADLESLTDPTRPLSYQTKSVKKAGRASLPRLQSILVEGDSRSAILNNKLYKKGQRVNGYLITRIDKNAVLMRYKTKYYKLTLYTDQERFIN
ncbi:hypothetical protein [Psychromonas aquimarina]|uniref:hypothetical protein n=1 Tax=Psychromonas aquimarina TaxID=444919 RepID=UPI0004202D1C|nr:hypothetical protein [Psychromonas aquimarina]